jgi:hypothetical protein
MSKGLINTADLAALVESKANVEATARKPSSDIVDGFLLHIKSGKNEMVLSTYLSDKPRLFKRSDALLKEATKMGLSSVRFELESTD